MKRVLAAAVLLLCLMPWAVSSADAGDRRNGIYGKRAISYYRAPRHIRPKVYGFYFGGVGGYSYTARDVINTYRDSRVRYGSVNFYRDPFVDRQSSFGPFDHGFFFDSAIAPRGGYAPYQH